MKVIFALLVSVLMSCSIVSQLDRGYSPPDGTALVLPSDETDAVKSTDDAADDPCIWFNPAHPESSFIIGTDKNSRDGGLYWYYLDGTQAGFVSDPSVNNVDIRSDFLRDSIPCTLVAASRRSDSTISIYTVSSAGLTPAGSQKTPTCEPYGFCLGRDENSGKTYAFITTKAGPVEQWELFFVPGDSVRGTHVRTLPVPSQTEGCVVDDASGRVFVGEENGGIWEFTISPSDSSPGVLVADVKKDPLVADVEGLAIYRDTSGRTVLCASSQGNSTFALFHISPAVDYITSFAITDSDSIDAVTGTDGIDISSRAFGEKYPRGIFVAQDDVNPGSTQNFKIVDWRKIEPLIVTK